LGLIENGNITNKVKRSNTNAYGSFVSILLSDLSKPKEKAVKEGVQ
jgi:hypothetical protein